MAKEILSQSFRNQLTNNYLNKVRGTTGIVIDVILNTTGSPELATENTEDFSTKKDTRNIGYVVIKKTDSLSVSYNYSGEPIPPYIPDEDLPLKNEEVELITRGSVLYYKRVSSTDLNSGNANPNKLKKSSSLSEDSDSSSSSSDYKTTSSTGTTESSGEDSMDNIGKYFKSSQTNKIVRYEGDKIIESRFGQSIRFSGYNNTDKILSPTIIIRNRQNDESLSKLKKFDLTEENINKDGSTIALTSNKYKLNFQPGIVDDGGTSDFKTKPIKFDPPKEYVGYDQMLLNSERIIISAKSQEMIFFSKGNYGFISDGKFTIDNGTGGADLDFGDDVNITTDRNNSDFSINTGNGSVYLNTDTKDEPLVRGESLVELLKELIDAINKQKYNTPSGPTAVGPTNRADFNDIKSRLNDVLSTLNFTE